MRKCANCGTINSDDKSECGVCRLSLAGTTSVNLEQATQPHESIVRMRKRSRKTGTALLVAGPGLLVAGVVSLFLLGPLGIIPLLSGVVLTAFVIYAVSNAPTRPWSGGTPKKGMGPPGVRSRAVDPDKREMERQVRKPEAED